MEDSNMNNLKKVIDNQQKINEAVNNIMEYFSEEMPYVVHLETMLDAQTQILGMMDLVKKLAMTDRNGAGAFELESVTLFLQDVRHYLTMLKPFVEMIENNK